MVSLFYIVYAILIVPVAGVLCYILDVDKENIFDVIFLSFIGAMVLLYIGLCGF